MFIGWIRGVRLGMSEKPLTDTLAAHVAEGLSERQNARKQIPDFERARSPGCPDHDWCSANRACWWNCDGQQTGTKGIYDEI